MVVRDTLYQIKEERLHILFGKLSRIHTWNCGSLRASFWRCYCPLDNGGIIVHGDEEVPMSPGMAYMIPPLTDFSSRSAQPFTKVFSHFSFEIPNVSFTPGVYAFSLSERLCDDLEQLRGDSEMNLSVELLMLQAVSLGLSSMPRSSRQELTNDPRVQSIIQLMHDDPSESMTNAGLAQRLHMTIPSMIRLFRSSMGTSPQRYIKNLRLKHAGMLLVHTEKSIEEIADICGYWDRNHFTRAFTTFFQYPPAAYRKLNRG